MALSNNARGALLMMAAMASFTFNDAFVKAVSDELPLFQTVFLRGIGTVLLIAVMAWRMGMLRWDFPARDRWLVALRSIAEIGSTYFYLEALFHMPLANVAAIFQALPLAITLAGAIFLREAVGWKRLTAIAIGFGGVLLIVQPGREGFTVYSLYALASVACVVVRDLVVRQMSQDVPTMMVALGAAVAVTLSAGAASVSETWVMPSALAVGQVSAAMVLVVTGYYFSVQTMRVGDLSFVAPFRYTGLLWALVLQVTVFSDWPDGWMLLGAAIIVATGLFTLLREARLAKASPAPASQAASRPETTP